MAAKHVIAKHERLCLLHGKARRELAQNLQENHELTLDSRIKYVFDTIYYSEAKMSAELERSACIEVISRYLKKAGCEQELKPIVEHHRRAFYALLAELKKESKPEEN